MERMAQWAVIIPADQWATERLFHHDTVIVRDATDATPVAGDDALLVAGEEPQAVALGRFSSGTEIAYTRRAFDEPVPADDLKLTEPVTALDGETFQRLVSRLGADQQRKAWLVSVALPIEATNRAEAVRQFWSYVRELGPAELPTFVWPSGDELAMQAFVLGAEANQDPEEDEED
jgi:hypothetical protein